MDGRSGRRGWSIVAATLCLAACERTPPARGNDSAESVAPLPAVTGDSALVPHTWRDSDGPFLAVATDDAHVVLLVAPDSADMGSGAALRTFARTVGAAPIALLGRSGLVAQATLQPRSIEQRHECEWPRATIATRDALGEEAHWGVGIAGAVATPVVLDSLERLSRADSARLVADLARIASALPDDTVPVFHGIPFSVRSAWTFAPAPGTLAVIGEISRRVAQEANQREERLLLLAERDSVPGARWQARWQARWWVRAWGSEETVEALDVLAVLRLARDRGPTLVVGHDAPAGLWQELVARDSTGLWRRRWRSGVSGPCA